jgi:CRISPR system Cascade subunit CasA
MTERPKTACFNLVDEPWLPVTLAEDFPDRAEFEPLPRVSLRTAFEYGNKIIDVRCYAHERIALMRLLICIAQRALNGPNNEADWKPSVKQLGKAAVKYLESNTKRFNLFGGGPRFLQAKSRRKATTFSTQKFRHIDEDGTTLFDAHVEPGCRLSHAELAVGLVTFQSFAAGGRVEGAAESLPAGLCREASALHSLLLGNSLLESIWLNLIPKDEVAGSKTLVFGDASWHGEEDAKKSYLYRLAPVARHVWLAEDGASVEGRGGRKFLTFDHDQVRELTAAVRAIRKTGSRQKTGSEELVSATAGGGVPKAAWRELHAVAVLRSARHRGGPPVLQHCLTLQTSNLKTMPRLWCGALVSNRAKVGDVIESWFRLPLQFLEDAESALEDDPRKQPGPNQSYRHGVGFADHWAGKLQWAVQVYHEALKDSFKQNPDRGKKIRNLAVTRYWSALEQRAERVLLHDVALNSSKYWSSEGDWMSKSPWGDEVRKAAHDAYDFACPHSTPRQLRAYAAGLAALRIDKRSKLAGDVEI